jgi:hypothetical protein
MNQFDDLEEEQEDPEMHRTDSNLLNNASKMWKTELELLRMKVQDVSLPAIISSIKENK